MHECKECGHQWPRSTVISVEQDGKYVTGRECPKCVAFVPSPPRGNVYKRRITDLERKLAVAVEALSDMVAVAAFAGWGEASTGRQIILRDAYKALEEIEK